MIRSLQLSGTAFILLNVAYSYVHLLSTHSVTLIRGTRYCSSVREINSGLPCVSNICLFSLCRIHFIPTTNHKRSITADYCVSVMQCSFLKRTLVYRARETRVLSLRVWSPVYLPCLLTLTSNSDRTLKTGLLSERGVMLVARILTR